MVLGIATAPVGISRLSGSSGCILGPMVVSVKEFSFHFALPGSQFFRSWSAKFAIYPIYPLNPPHPVTVIQGDGRSCLSSVNAMHGD